MSFPIRSLTVCAPAAAEPTWTMPEKLRSALVSLADGNGTGASSRPRVGSRLGKFELVEQLGAGAFGEVFRATDMELDRLVAVKVLRGGAGASHDDVDRFVREAQRRQASASRNRRGSRDRASHGRFPVPGRGICSG